MNAVVAKLPAVKARRLRRAVVCPTSTESLLCSSASFGTHPKFQRYYWNMTKPEIARTEVDEDGMTVWVTSTYRFGFM